ncbi:MAG: ACP S-malonyltransferase [Candidatus Caldarchaeum sp.]
MIAFIFPGQGSQYVGMGSDVYASFPVAKETFDLASDVLGMDLARLCFEGDPEELKMTANAQPAILTVSVALLRSLAEISDVKPDLVAGHSLGEYTALCATGALRFEDAVLVVRKRGEFMQNAVAAGEGAMAAVLGVLTRGIDDICRECSTDGLIVAPANFNAPGQVVISGNREAVAKAGELAKQYGARRVVPLEVSAPFHCPLMEPAASMLKGVLDGINIDAPRVPVVSNYDAEPNSDPLRIRHLLVAQVANPVRWQEGVERMASLGVDTFIEIGPGDVLSGLVKRIVPGKMTIKLENTKDIQEIEKNGI